MTRPRHARCVPRRPGVAVRRQSQDIKCSPSGLPWPKEEEEAEGKPGRRGKSCALARAGKRYLDVSSQAIPGLDRGIEEKLEALGVLEVPEVPGANRGRQRIGGLAPEGGLKHETPRRDGVRSGAGRRACSRPERTGAPFRASARDRKSTRLNSSHC